MLRFSSSATRVLASPRPHYTRPHYSPLTASCRVTLLTYSFPPFACLLGSWECLGSPHASPASYLMGVAPHLRPLPHQEGCLESVGPSRPHAHLAHSSIQYTASLMICPPPINYVTSLRSKRQRLFAATGMQGWRKGQPTQSDSPHPVRCENSPMPPYP